MEEHVQPRSLKLTIKVKSNKNISNNPTTADHVNNVTKDVNAPHTLQPCSQKNSSQDQAKLSSPDVIIDDIRTENEENQSSENSNQLVLYDPAVNGGQAETDPDPGPDPIGYRTPSLSRPHPFSNQTPRILPSVGAFTVQCANCFKWRLIPTKEMYEEIREHIIDQPFSCETAREWRPEISCDDDPDIMQDGSRLWAIDKPSIAQPPSGWQRLLRFRGEGSSKFADVYYVAPSGRRLRSMVEVQRFLDEHPEYVGVSLSQFSFQTPRPLQENYVRKRSARALTDESNGNGGPGSLIPSQVDPIAWTSPDLDTDLQLTSTGVSKHEGQSAKKKRSLSSKKNYNGDVIYDQNVVNLGESGQL